jgi:hypothetical protein
MGGNNYLLHKRQAKQNKIQVNTRPSSYTKYKYTPKLNMATPFWSVKFWKKAFLAKEYKIFLHSSREFKTRFYVNTRYTAVNLNLPTRQHLQLFVTENCPYSLWLLIFFINKINTYTVNHNSRTYGYLFWSYTALFGLFRTSSGMSEHKKY